MDQAIPAVEENDEIINPSLADKLRARFGGVYAHRVASSVSYCLKYGLSPCRYVLRDNILIYLLGYRAAFRLGIRSRSTEIMGRLTEPIPLYHMVHSSKLSSVKKKGLVCRGRYIFLTDSMIIADGYYKYKENLDSCCGERYVVGIDTARMLADGVPILPINYHNEYICSKIDKKYFTFFLPYEEFCRQMHKENRE